MKISREIKIGAFGIISIVLFVIALNFVKGKDIFQRHRTYYAVYNAASGLIKAAPVSINGFNIGKVTDIHFESNRSSRIVVELTIYNSIFIPSNTLAVISNLDLLGTKGIALQLGNATTPAQSGDTLASQVQASLTEEVNQQVAPIKQKAENLLSSLDTMVTVMQSVLNVQTRHNITESFQSIRNTLASLEKTSYNLDTLLYGQRKRLERILYNVEMISENFRKNNDNITHTLTNFSAISDTLAKANISKTFADVNKTLGDIAKITDKINAGQGSVGLLINNDKLYNNLEKSTNELNNLLRDMKLNPHRYLNFSVFPPGKKAMQYAGDTLSAK